MSRKTTSRTRERIRQRHLAEPDVQPFLPAREVRQIAEAWDNGVKHVVRVWMHTYYWLMRKHLPRSRYNPKRFEGNPAWRRKQEKKRDFQQAFSG